MSTVMADSVALKNWRANMLTSVMLKEGQTLRFEPPPGVLYYQVSGLMASGTPPQKSLIEIAKEHAYQECVIKDVGVMTCLALGISDPSLFIMVEFGDGEKQSFPALWFRLVE